MKNSVFYKKTLITPKWKATLKVDRSFFVRSFKLLGLQSIQDVRWENRKVQQRNVQKTYNQKTYKENIPWNIYCIHE